MNFSFRRYADSRNHLDAVFEIAVDNYKIFLRESTTQVDGIGGINWDGSLILNRFFSTNPLSTTLKMYELGAGSSIAGIALAMYGVNIVVTDRAIDLSNQNIQSYLSQVQSENLPFATSIYARELEWSDPNTYKCIDGLDSDLDVVVGIEIACLQKQHEILINSISHLCHNPKTIVLITFDGIPPRSYCNSFEFASSYERRFVAKMELKGFKSQLVATGTIH